MEQTELSKTLAVIKAIIQRAVEEKDKDVGGLRGGRAGDNVSFTSLQAVPTLLANVSREVRQLEDDRTLLLKDIAQSKRVVQELTSVAEEQRVRMGTLNDACRALQQELDEAHAAQNVAAKQIRRLEHAVDVLQIQNSAMEKVSKDKPITAEAHTQTESSLQVSEPPRLHDTVSTTKQLGADFHTLQMELQSAKKTIDVLQAENRYCRSRQQQLQEIVDNLRGIILTQQDAIEDMAAIDARCRRERLAAEAWKSTSWNRPTAAAQIDFPRDDTVGSREAGNTAEPAGHNSALPNDEAAHWTDEQDAYEHGDSDYHDDSDDGSIEHGWIESGTQHSNRVSASISVPADTEHAWMGSAATSSNDAHEFAVENVPIPLHAGTDRPPRSPPGKAGPHRRVAVHLPT